MGISPLRYGERRYPATLQRATNGETHRFMNFALILFLLTVATGLIALADRVLLARNRPAGA